MLLCIFPISKLSFKSSDEADITSEGPERWRKKGFTSRG